MKSTPPPEEPKRERSRHRHRHKRHRTRWRFDFDWKGLAPLAVFAAMVILAPLLFGAVDRIVQLGLVFLLAVGMLFIPPAWPRLSRRATIFAAAIAGVLLLKELAPAALFGGVKWRSEIDLPLPWTHHPEPARVLDVLLVAGVAILWFQWVRTLAADGERRVKMAWILGASGVVLALVCFAMRVNPARPYAIYGLRETEGWIGWGPFPNRNHTSSFLAMSALCLGGCVWWAVAKRKRVALCVGGLGVVLILAALLAGKSRGGLLAFAAGLAVLLGLVVWRKRTRRTVFVAVTILLVALAGFMAFGGKVLERFRSAEQGIVSNETRVLIWREALGMWKDAPLFGHGADTFTQLFPLYQKADLDGKTVMHPESSWVQWLDELGLVAVVVLAGVLGWFILRQLRLAQAQRRIFYVTAGLLAGALALIAHAVIDVPGHRWATAGLALALLGVAFPLAEAVPSSRRCALVPLGIGAFWVLPLVGVALPWMTLTPTMLLNRETRASGAVPTLAEWDGALRWFPLDAWMRQFAGLRALEENPAARRWERDFAAARRLLPSGFWMPQMQAQALSAMARRVAAATPPTPAAPDLARALAVDSISLWQDAVDCGGRQWSELLRNGVRNTAAFAGTRLLWSQFIEARPRFALTYAQVLMEELRIPDANVRAYFDIWWENQVQAGATELANDEAALFYRCASRWSTPAQFEVWMTRYRKRLRTDYRTWMALLREWKKDTRAWEVYRAAVPEPPDLAQEAGATRQTLEDRHRIAPDDASVTLELAQLLEKEGDLAGSTRVLLEAARRPGPAPRLLRKAAYRLASENRIAEAVAMALQEKPGGP